jgi:FMN reductase
MTTILTIGGSPSHPSRSAALLDYCRIQLESRGLTTENITVRDLNAEELIQGRFDGPSLKPAFDQVAAADGIIIATPVYKAAYTGVLKAFFDLLPANALGRKVILPIALGGSLAHSLVIDYALRPVLTAMGASHILHGGLLDR